VLRHSTAHVLAQAVLELWPGAHFAIGRRSPTASTTTSSCRAGLTSPESDLGRIEDKMRAIVAERGTALSCGEEALRARRLELFADQP